jgi:hypothetical protein
VIEQPSKDGKGVKNITPEKQALSEKTPANGHDPWGVRIASTPLIDLSDEERSALAEHVRYCSACAALVQEYEFIETSIRKLPNLNLLREKNVYLQRANLQGKRQNGDCKAYRRKNAPRVLLAHMVVSIFTAILASLAKRGVGK